MKKIHRYDEKVDKNNHTFKMSSTSKWVIEIVLMAFFLSLALSFTADTVIPNVPIGLSFVILFLFIGLGIIFDMIGVAVTVAEKKTFNSMASKKVRGAKTALMLINNNSRVSSFCNDVVGDICGIISGAAGITIATSFADIRSINVIILNLLFTAFIASATIGGKAIGKSYAINKANKILFRFAVFLDFITFNRKNI